MKRAKERDSSETAAIKINRRKVCLLIIAIGISSAAADYHAGPASTGKKQHPARREENHARFDVTRRLFRSCWTAQTRGLATSKTQSMRYPIWKRPVRQIFWPIWKQPA